MKRDHKLGTIFIVHSIFIIYIRENLYKDFFPTPSRIVSIEVCMMDRSYYPEIQKNRQQPPNLRIQTDFLQAKPNSTSDLSSMLDRMTTLCEHFRIEDRRQQKRVEACLALIPHLRGVLADVQTILDSLQSVNRL